MEGRLGCRLLDLVERRRQADVMWRGGAAAGSCARLTGSVAVMWGERGRDGSVVGARCLRGEGRERRRRELLAPGRERREGEAARQREAAGEGGRPREEGDFNLAKCAGARWISPVGYRRL
jgi:hypothetical protein